MIRGFCADIPFLKATAQESRLVELGVDADKIYVDGRRGESFGTCLRALRKGDTLAIVGTLQVFGDSRRAMRKAVDDVRAKGAEIVDLETRRRSDRDGFEMLDDALRRTHGSAKVRGSKKFAAKIGAKGGNAKLESMRGRRMPEEIARPIWRHPSLTIAEKLDLMNPRGYFERKWTEATARRRLQDE